MLALSCLLAGAAACTNSGSGSLGDVEPTPAEPDPTGEPVVSEETLDLDPADDGAAFFPGDRFVQIHIELPSSSWDALTESPYDWAPADVVLDGRRIEDVAVRLRGRIGSFRTVGEKPKWKIDFNRYVPGRRVDGLEALSLDNNVVDCSGLKQKLGFEVLSLAGIPASRAGFGEVYVNDAYYGVYNTIEPEDDRLLRRFFEDGTGTLYDGAYLWHEPGLPEVQLLDFVPHLVDLYQLEEGVDVGHEDLARVADVLAAAAYEPGFVDAMSEVFDMEAFYIYFAAEQWIGQNDGYVLNTNNNRVYFDPIDGRARFISYDLDYAFMPWPWEFSYDNPRGFLAHACVHDAECSEGIAQAMEGLLNLLEEQELDQRFEAWDDATWNEAAADPKLPCGGGDLWNARGSLRNWIQNRGPTMRNYWGIP
ncbi:MAG: hypothetical protein GY898_07440 [Proteobacteria bacterium]|nr:hypothetical protein [Pseudomonadota bacterium]